MGYWEGPYIKSYAPSDLTTPKEVTDNGRTVNKIYAISAKGALGAGEFKGGSATVPIEQRDNYPLVEMGDIIVAYTLNRLAGAEIIRKAVITTFIVIDVALGETEDGRGTVTYSGPGITKELIRKVLRSPYISTKYSGTSTAYTETYVFLDAAHAAADNFYNGGVIEINGSLADIWGYSSADNRAYVNNWRGNAPEDGNDPLPYIIHFGKATDNLDQAVSYSQTSWVNSINGGSVSGTPGGSFHVIDGRDVLSMVNVVAEETGYQYRELLTDPPNRQLDWFEPQGTPVTSGVYLGAKSEFTEAQLYADVTKSVVISCQQETSRRDKWTRMIVSTADGLTLHGLTLSDITVPTGFSVDFDQSMVTNTAAEVGLTTPEIFEKTHIFKDITSPSNTDEAKKQTQIALFNATIHKMHYKAGQFNTYHVRTVLLRDLTVGQQLYLKYVHTVPGSSEVLFSVDKDVWIRAISMSCSAEDGVRYIDLELGDQFEADISDGNRATARAIKDSRGASGQIFFGTPSLGGGVTDHGQLIGLTDVIDHPGYLTIDGSRALTGNMAVNSGVTIDGIDISVHATDPDAHHDQATAGTHISLNGQEISVTGTADAQNNPSKVLIPDANGRFRTSGIGIDTATEGDHLVFGDNANAYAANFSAADDSGFTRRWYLDTNNSDGEATLYISNIVADTLTVYLFHGETIIATTSGAIFTKSIGIVSETFSVPSTGNSVAIIVNDNPVLGTAGVFEENDKVVFRAFERDSGLTVGWVGGYVDSYSDNGDGTQDWTFHRQDSNVGLTGLDIQIGSVIIDYGTPGQGWVFIDASKDTGPNISTGTWDGNNPWEADNRTITTYAGRLFPITEKEEYGFFAGESLDGAHVLFSDSRNEIQDTRIAVRKSVADSAGIILNAIRLHSDVESDILPNGDISATNVTKSTGTSSYYTYIDDDPASPDSLYLRNNLGSDATLWLNVQDISHTLTTLEVEIHVGTTGFVNDKGKLRAQMFEPDGVTKLTDEIKLASEKTVAAGALLTIPFTGVVTTATDTAWAQARLLLTWEHQPTKSDEIIVIDPEEGINIDSYSTTDNPGDDGEFVAAEYNANALTFGALGYPKAAIYTGADLGQLNPPMHIRAFPDPTWGMAEIWIEALTDTSGDFGRLSISEYGISVTVDDNSLFNVTAANGVRIAKGIYVGDAGATGAAAGQVILDQGTANVAQISARSDSVTGSALSHTNEYFSVAKASSTIGCGWVRGYGEAGFGLWLTGYAGEPSSNYAPLMLAAIEDSATTLADTDNLLILRNNATDALVVKGDGALWITGTYETYDHLDDVAVTRKLALLGTRIKGAFDQHLRDDFEMLEREGLVERRVSGIFVNTTGVMKLHHGAIWQLNEKIETLEKRSVYYLIQSFFERVKGLVQR